MAGCEAEAEEATEAAAKFFLCIKNFVLEL